MRDTVLMLFDKTGNMAQPWVECGFNAIIVDIKHESGVHQDGKIIRIGADIRNGFEVPENFKNRIGFVACFPPCDHLAVSGARWFKGKGLRALSLSQLIFSQLLRRHANQLERLT